MNNRGGSMIVSNMTMLLLFCIIYTACLSIIYFSKQRINNKENKIYKKLIILNIIGLIIQLMCDYVSYRYDYVSQIFSGFVLRIYLVYFVLWINEFMFYLIVITRDKFDDKWMKIFTIIESIIAFVLPFELYTDSANGIYYTTGPAITFTFLLSSLIITIMIFLVIKYWKKSDKKKLIPILLFAIFGMFAAILQMAHPELVITTVAESLICFIMYFTIENPDIKIIEQLQLAKEQADKANQAKTDFLSSMSHEIRTPLNAIVGFSDCICHADTLEEAKDNAKDIVNASNTLLEIVNGILDISKIEAGKLEIVNSPYDAKELFSSLAKLIKPRMNEKGLDFQVYIAPDLPKVLYGDHANVKKVVTNILSNASKYTDKGFVRYEVNCVNNGNRCRLIISVEDSGRGIKKENIDKLFTKFQRLEEDRNTTIEGTGLGLAITKQLVELMGGKVIVHTVYGEGSKFTIILDQPIEKESALQKVQGPNLTHLDLTGVKILIVDDNTLNLKVSTKLFERYHATIECVDSGFRCLEKIQAGEKYDIILLDDMMPKMSGVETLKKLKQLPNFSTPVVALTANAITGMREKYISDGFNDYLAKPIEKDEMIRVFASILHLSEDVTGKLFETTELLDMGDEVFKSSTSGEVYNEDYLRSHGVDIDHALDLLGDMEMYHMTLHDYLDEIDGKVEQLKKYLDVHDMPNYAILVHSMKSDAKYLGFMTYADICYQHELKSKENDYSYCVEHFSELKNELQKYLDVVREYSKHIN